MLDKDGLSEKEFLAQYDANAFERPSLAVDICVLTVIAGQLKVGVYKRDAHPQMHSFALPGGFVHIDESLDDAAARLLRDKVGVQNVYLEQLRAFGRVDRDPRTRIVTIAYFALVPPEVMLRTQVQGSVIADVMAHKQKVKVSVAGEGLETFTDHADIIFATLQRVRGELEQKSLAYSLLPKAFTLRALQDVHEALRGENLNKDSFRRKVLKSQTLKETGKVERASSKRPAALYRFKKTKVSL